MNSCGKRIRIFFTATWFVICALRGGGAVEATSNWRAMAPQLMPPDLNAKREARRFHFRRWALGLEQVCRSAEKDHHQMIVKLKKLRDNAALDSEQLAMCFDELIVREAQQNINFSMSSVIQRVGSLSRLEVLAKKKTSAAWLHFYICLLACLERSHVSLESPFGREMSVEHEHLLNRAAVCNPDPENIAPLAELYEHGFAGVSRDADKVFFWLTTLEAAMRMKLRMELINGLVREECPQRTKDSTEPDRYKIKATMCESRPRLVGQLIEYVRLCDKLSHTCLRVSAAIADKRSKEKYMRDAKIYAHRSSEISSWCKGAERHAETACHLPQKSTSVDTAMSTNLGKSKQAKTKRRRNEDD